jgi:uncharacterized protein
MLVLLILTEIFTPLVLRQHLYNTSKARYSIAVAAHVVMSIWLWILFLEHSLNKSHIYDQRHVWMEMALNGTFVTVVIPRVILSLTHFTGRLIRIRSSGHIKWLTNTGVALSAIIFLIIGSGIMIGRLNFKTEYVTIRIKGLHNDLDGLKIVQMSDLHISGFYHHMKLIDKVISGINEYRPDLILNTGDFVTSEWREYDRTDTILLKARGKYGNYAVMGNHDFGTYQHFFTREERRKNVELMNELISSSGYRILNDENVVINIGNAKIALIGITTTGSYPDIKHGDLGKAVSGLDSADLKILLSHDPNQWESDVKGKTDIDLTLSGHTHGMQMGIITKKFRWSPAKYFYPHWNGLYSSAGQYHYVNRGAGVLSIPFRIWMPPEITVITLKADQN